MYETMVHNTRRHDITKLLVEGLESCSHLGFAVVAASKISRTWLSLLQRDVKNGLGKEEGKNIILNDEE